MRQHPLASGCRSLIGLLVAAALLGGCAKPVFTLVDKKVCKGVDRTGNAQEPTTTFAPTDGRVCVWFQYRNAAPGQVLKAKFACTDPLGAQSKDERQTELKPGSRTGVVELTGPQGGALTPGR